MVDADWQQIKLPENHGVPTGIVPASPCGDPAIPRRTRRGTAEALWRFGVLREQCSLVEPKRGSLSAP